jgi:hypothetical protein
MWDYRARPLEVLDGDTVRLEADLGYYARHRVDVRLLDVHAPELGQPGGTETRAFVEDWMAGLPAIEWPLDIRTQITRVTEPTERMSFTRYVGDIRDMLSLRWLNADVREYLDAHPEWGPGN